MKRILSLILTLFLLLSLAACGASPSPAPDSSTDPAAPDEPSHEAAVTALTSLDGEGDPGPLCALDGTRVLVQYGALSGGEGSEEQVYGTHLALVDTESDAVTATAAITDDESLLGVLPGGEILTCSDDGLTLNVYRDDLTLERAVPLPEGCTGSGVILDRFGGRLFCLEGDTLCEISPDSGSATPFFTIPAGEEFYAVDGGSGQVLCQRDDPGSLSGRVLTLYDKNGAVLLSGDTDAFSCFFHGGQAVSRARRIVSDDGGVTFAEHVVLTRYEGDKATALDLGPAWDFSWPEGTNLAFSVESVERRNGQIDLIPRFLDLERGKAAAVDLEEEDGVYAVIPCFLPDVNKFLLAVSRPGNFGPGQMRLYLADPDAMEFPADLTSCTPDGTEGVRTCREENGRLLRALADGIQADFPVTVLLGSECTDVTAAATYAYVLTDARGEDTAMETWRMLTGLRENLEVFPEGLLEKFRDANGQGGLRFLLVKALRNERFESFNAAGVTYRTQEDCLWYNIAASIGEGPTIYPHEMWHAVEDRMDDESFPAFDSGDWWPLNPYGFEYFYDLDTYEARSAEWGWALLDGGDDPYFIRSYSTVNDMEDRATLIEALYSGVYGDDPASSLEAIRACPHLADKLDMMADRVRSVFGSVYWEPQA